MTDGESIALLAVAAFIGFMAGIPVGALMKWRKG